MNFSSLRPAGHSLLRAAQASATRRAPTVVAWGAQRWYASAGGLTREEITNRVLDVVKGFEGVDSAAVKLDSAFIKDLKLDSLDTVELVLQIEDAFTIEIPDDKADAIQTVQDAVDYIAQRDEAS